MNPTLKQGLLIGILLIVIYLIYKQMMSEGFSSKREKAEAINTWWSNESSPSYKEYKNDIPHSDIVEYGKVKDLKKSGGLSTDNIEKLIG